MSQVLNIESIKENMRFASAADDERRPSDDAIVLRPDFRRLFGGTRRLMRCSPTLDRRKLRFPGPVPMAGR